MKSANKCYKPCDKFSNYERSFENLEQHARSYDKSDF